jgi:PEP-CTERM motif
LKTQYLAIALLSSVVMPITANAETVILSFEQVPDTTLTENILPYGIQEFAPVYVSDQTVNGVLGEFVLTAIPEIIGPNLWSGEIDIVSETGVGGFSASTSSFYGDFTTYLSGDIVNVDLSNPNFVTDLGPSFSTDGLIEAGLLAGNDKAIIALDPSVEGVVVTPEPSTWAMMLIGFVGLGWFAKRRNRLATI